MRQETIPQSGNSQNGKKKGKGNHGVKLTPDQYAALKRYMKGKDSITAAAIGLGIGRDPLTRLLKFRSASSETIKNVLANVEAAN